MAASDFPSDTREALAAVLGTSDRNTAQERAQKRVNEILQEAESLNADPEGRTAFLREQLREARQTTNEHLAEFNKYTHQYQIDEKRTAGVAYLENLQLVEGLDKEMHPEAHRIIDHALSLEGEAQRILYLKQEIAKIENLPGKTMEEKALETASLKETLKGFEEDLHGRYTEARDAYLSAQSYVNSLTSGINLDNLYNTSEQDLMAHRARLQTEMQNARNEELYQRNREKTLSEQAWNAERNMQTVDASVTTDLNVARRGILENDKRQVLIAEEIAKVDAAIYAYRQQYGSSAATAAPPPAPLPITYSTPPDADFDNGQGIKIIPKQIAKFARNVLEFVSSPFRDHYDFQQTFPASSMVGPALTDSEKDRLAETIHQTNRAAMEAVAKTNHLKFEAKQNPDGTSIYTLSGEIKNHQALIEQISNHFNQKNQSATITTLSNDPNVKAEPVQVGPTRAPTSTPQPTPGPSTAKKAEEELEAQQTQRPTPMPLPGQSY